MTTVDTASELLARAVVGFVWQVDRAAVWLDRRAHHATH